MKAGKISFLLKCLPKKNKKYIYIYINKIFHGYFEALKEDKIS